MEDFHRRAKIYARCRIAAGIASFAVTVFFLAWLQWGGPSRAAADAARSLTPYFYVRVALFAVWIFAACAAVQLPLKVLGGFLIERLFGMSAQTFSAWVKDEMKGVALSSVFFIVIVEIAYCIMRSTGDAWWLGLSLVLLLISSAVTFIFPVVIIPLFYTYRPITDEALCAGSISLAGYFGFRVVDVSEINYSRTSNKANAAIVGLGKTRRIILTDTLVREFDRDEVSVIIAHEMAHVKRSHLWKLIAIGAASSTFFLWALNAARIPAASFLGVGSIFDIEALPGVLLLMNLGAAACAPVNNALSRAMERSADRLALEATRLAGPFIAGMERLARKNLSDVSPHPLVEALFLTHPSVSKRIAMARRWKERF